MKRIVAVLLLVTVAAWSGGCGKPPETTTGTAPAVAPAGGPVITAVFGTIIAKKPIDHAIAKKNGENEVTIYLYSFKTTETWPGAEAYAADDFFLDATIKAPLGLAAGEYAGDSLSLTLHTKESNYGFMKSRGSIVITEIAGGKLKGEFKLDDGYVKVSGPFEIDLV